MGISITLKDRVNADVVFQEASHDGNVIVLVSAGTSLLDRKQITLQLKTQGQATNRIIAKLSIPTVSTDPSTGLPAVAYTEVGSMDLTAVKAASANDAENLVKLFSGLASSNTIAQMYRNAIVANTPA